MDAELRKRLNEAAHESSMGELIFGREVSCWIGGFKAGAEWGYKEAIKVAKEWLMNYFVFDNSLMSASGCDLFLRAFEAGMNKLSEEQK